MIGLTLTHMQSVTLPVEVVERQSCGQPSALLASPCAAIAADPCSSVERCQQVSAEGWHPGVAARIPHAAACLRPAAGGRRFPLKTVGDYVGHRSPSSTMIYAKVQVDALREVALGDGEELQ
jgi:hypothetical protein